MVVWTGRCLTNAWHHQKCDLSTHRTRTQLNIVRYLIVTARRNGFVLICWAKPGLGNSEKWFHFLHFVFQFVCAAVASRDVCYYRSGPGQGNF